MADVLVIQNTQMEGSGSLGQMLESDGFDINTIHAKRQSIPVDDHLMLVILGGPAGANDDLPYLKNEQDLIRQYMKKNIPVLGICLGSQLIAKTFGAKVLRGRVTEIGFYDDVIPDTDSTFFSGFTNPFSVFHWHQDTFDLPKNAVRLASSTQYANQAFRLGSAVGVQFHLEINRDMIHLWLDNTWDKLERMPHIDPQKIRNDIDANISKVESNMTIFYKNFKSAFDL